MKTYLTSIMLSMLLFNLNAFALDQTLVKATVQDESRELALILVLDKNRDINQFKIAEFNGGKKTSEDTYGVDGAHDGIVILNQSGRDVVKLVSKNFSSYQGGHVTLDYLYNGITGSRGSIEVDLARDGDKWSMRVNGDKVNSMHFVKNKKALVGVIGIKRIEFK